MARACYKELIFLSVLLKTLLLVFGSPVERDGLVEESVDSDFDPQDYVHGEKEYQKVLAQLLRESLGDNPDEGKISPPESNVDQLGEGCSICDNNLRGESVTFDCNHEFHEFCLVGYFSGLNRAVHIGCPKCNRKAYVDGREYIRGPQNQAGSTQLSDQAPIRVGEEDFNGLDIEKYNKFRSKLNEAIIPDGTVPDDYMPDELDMDVIMAKIDANSQLAPIEECCCICYDEFGELDRVKFDCDHEFHKGCLKRWAQDFGRNAHMLCPKCKSKTFVDGQKWQHNDP